MNFTIVSQTQLQLLLSRKFPLEIASEISRHYEHKVKNHMYNEGCEYIHRDQSLHSIKRMCNLMNSNSYTKLEKGKKIMSLMNNYINNCSSEYKYNKHFKIGMKDTLLTIIQTY